MSSYTSSIRKQLQYYQHLGERTIMQLSADALLYRPNEGSNSIAIIVRHLHGNMLSRWTDFLTTDGEKSWRDRDGEFEISSATREELLSLWEEAFCLAIGTLESLGEGDLEDTVFIRNEGHTVIEAINRQLAHTAYHVGQMVYIGKLVTGEKWETLSIPKNKSKEYNQAKFGEPKRSAHYSDEFLSDDNKGR